MTDRALFAEASKTRRLRVGPTRETLPAELQRDQDFHSELRTEMTQRDGQDFVLVEGYASMTEVPYEMWDDFGPYHEVVSRAAFDETLAADPMVVFRFNHSGMSMANTKNGRLELWADSTGFGDRAWVNPQRSDVQDMVRGIKDEDVTEQSFMFTIEAGEWSDDYSEYRINRVNMDRGDVGPVSYGANPHTKIVARSGELLRAIPDLPPLAAREAYNLLIARPDLVIPDSSRAVVNGTGSSIRLEQMRLEIEQDA